MPRRYRMPAPQRRIGGRVYKYLMVGTKAESERDAERYRNKGYSVRIMPWMGKYAIYIRTK